MNNLPTYVRQSQAAGALRVAVVSLATALIAVSLVALGATTWKGMWLGPVANSLASVLLASVFVTWMGNYLLRKDFLKDVEQASTAALEGQLIGLRQIEHMGIADVFTEFPSDLARVELKGASSTVRILQTWVSNFESIENAIGNALANGAEVKVLVIGDRSLAARRRAQDLGFLDEADAHEAIRASNQHLKRFIGTSHRERLEVREYDALPSIQLYAGDSEGFVGLFWHGKPSLVGPTLRVRLESEFGQELVRDFEWLWARASPWVVRQSL